MAWSVGDRSRGARIPDEALERFPHACAFFNGAEEQYAFTVPFVKEGVERGEKVVEAVDPAVREAHAERLRAEGVAGNGEGAGAGQLELLTWDDAHLKGGSFDPGRMLEDLETILRKSREQGFERTRTVGHMEWALEDRPGVERLLEYEARVNDLVARYRPLAVCVYDLSRFSTGLMLDVLRTHPMVVIGGAMYENPFYMEPELFLEELAGREDPAGDGRSA